MTVLVGSTWRPPAGVTPILTYRVPTDEARVRTLVDVRNAVVASPQTRFQEWVARKDSSGAEKNAVSDALRPAR